MSSTKTYLDPDYEFTTVAAERKKIRLEKEQNEAIQKAKELINRQFENEYKERQNQLELIQQRLTKAQKTLHLLRYVLVTSYYNRKDLEVTFPEATVSNSDESTAVGLQHRIHPALKKLLGRDPSNLNVLYNTGLRNRSKLKHSLINTVIQESEDSSLKTPKAKVKEENIEIDSNENLALKNDNKISHHVRNRKKQKHRIVIGNISKWMPSDSSTHKWMVYVRGPKENPDISNIVRKVIFHLHPSYKPNDVVELKSPPFHLARRGWGEFPLRVKIFFHSSLNKPVDVIHNLKLDRTYTGHQTLGNETIIDIFLYEHKSPSELEQDESNCSEENKDDFQDQHVFHSGKDQQREDDMQMMQTMCISSNNAKLETSELLFEEETKFNQKEYDTGCLEAPISKNDYQEKVKEEEIEIDENYFEHDYCYKDVAEDISSFNAEESRDEENKKHDNNFEAEPNSLLSSLILDHDYCLPSFKSNLNNNTLQPENDTIYTNSVEEDNINVKEEIVLEEFNPNLILELSQSDMCKLNLVCEEAPVFQKALTEDGKIILIKKWKMPQQSLLKPQVSEKNKYISETKPGSVASKFKIYFPAHRFKSTIEALPFLMKKLPIITEHATNPEYKVLHPYTATSLEEYSSWIPERRLSSEWFRAKLIKDFLTCINLSGYENWSTKAIIMFARAYGFTPMASYSIFKKHQFDINYQLLIKHPTTASTVSQNPSLRNSEQDIEVDVDTQSEELNKQKKLNTLFDPNLEMECSYIRQAVLDIGIILKPEEIVPGYLFNSAERVLLQATSTLAENLIRKARANLVLKCNFSETENVINVEDVLNVLHHRPELNFILVSNDEYCR